MTVGRVYAQVEDKRKFSRPQKIKAPPNRRDQKKYCEYHKNHGNNTDEADHLGGQGNGHTGETQGTDKGATKTHPHEKQVYALSPMTTIDREPISFSESELVGLELPHDEPLVISPIIANFVVARILLDTESSADILYLQEYDQLGLPHKHLKPVSTPLT
ncbi:hypothetical protein LIER_16277 [Lithospermum erythrorhizon]|uniref:Uncharacterized protein n=1 Tax=Lithospermum erythrorhizon TaxID=34254 RepID=A0AAV3Q8J0_LITER